MAEQFDRTCIIGLASRLSRAFGPNKTSNAHHPTWLRLILKPEAARTEARGLLVGPRTS
jgi:hypothetical protein